MFSFSFSPFFSQSYPDLSFFNGYSNRAQFLISEEKEGDLGGKMRLLRVATCNLNQWAMDFDTNLRNVKESIARAKTAGAVVRIGPELELTGYGCEDHFLEQDTTEHA